MSFRKLVRLAKIKDIQQFDRSSTLSDLAKFVRFLLLFFATRRKNLCRQRGNFGTI